MMEEEKIIIENPILQSTLDYHLQSKFQNNNSNTNREISEID